MNPIPTPALVLLTDRTKMSPNWTLAQTIAPAITGGCNLVILRESDIPANHRKTVARFAVDGVKGRVPLLIADDPTLTVSVGAGGVHLSSLPPNPEEIRALMGPKSVMGVSVRNREEALEAARFGDYLLIAYDWSAPDRVLDNFRSLREGITCPVIIGLDMPVEFVPRCLDAGAAGVAICAPAMNAYDRTAACRAYADALGLRP